MLTLTEAIVWCLLLFMLGPVLLYMLTRGVSYAWFRSRLEFERKVSELDTIKEKE